MEFTPQEQKMIEALRRKQRRPRLMWANWAMLSLGIFQIAIAIGLFVLMGKNQPNFKPADPPDAAIDFLMIRHDLNIDYLAALTFSSAFCLLICGGQMLTTTFLHWRQNPTETLLLKLIEQQEKDAKARQEKPGCG